MSLTRPLITTIALGMCITCHASTRHRYECPSPLVDGKGTHALAHVEVFDGPPQQQASLEMWKPLKGKDPYLVCTYQGTDTVTTIHAVGANACDATDKPGAAYCD
jgi:hypothetical protein